MNLKKLVPVFALAAIVATGCGDPAESASPAPSSGTTIENTQIRGKAIDGHEHGTINYGIHVGPHLNISTGKIEMGPSIGLGIDF